MVEAIGGAGDLQGHLRHYQTLDFKLIKELKTAVVQYGPSAQPLRSACTLQWENQSD